MEDFVGRFLNGLMSRLGGVMSLRLMLQPTMAALLAVRAGVNDAREGRPAYLWTVLTDRSQRVSLLREGWKSVARVFLLAAITDVIYQWFKRSWLYPMETLTVAFILAVVPYVLIRGPANRIQRYRDRKRS